MKRIFIAFLAANFAILSGCTPILTANDGKYIGWLKYNGEFRLFKDPASLEQNLKYPACVSGVFPHNTNINLKFYDRKKVEIIGSLLNYDSLPVEQGPLAKILPRKIAGGNVVPNFCMSPSIILAKSIKQLS